MLAPTVAQSPSLEFNEAQHRYSVNGRELTGVTRALTDAGLIDTRWFNDAACLRGTYVHAAIVMLHDGDLAEDSLDPILKPYVDAYRAFLDQSALRLDAIEERVFNEALGCAGTLDLRGQFPNDPPNVTNVIDIKTGFVPPHVGFQTAGYVRLLPIGAQPVRRRWALNLRADATYRLEPLTKRTDESVFLAAVTVAQAKRGWL